jgi:peptide alpha-N-acetyltransferase
MLVVIKPYRGKGIELVTRCIQVMRDSGCDEVTLEAEVTNKGALALYGNLAFICAKCLHRYYLNSVDAFPLKLLFPRLPDPNNLFALAGVGHDHGNVHHDCMHHQHQKDQEHCAGNEYPHVGHNHHHPRWEGDYRLSTTADK